MKRPQTKAAIKEDIKHVFKESHRLEPEDIPYEIFAREAKNGMHEILSIPKDKTCKFSHRTDSSDDVCLSPIDAGRMRLLLHCQKHLTDQGL